MDDGTQRSRLRDDVDKEEFSEARIDIRKFAQFLTGQQVNPTRVICSKYIALSEAIAEWIR